MKKLITVLFLICLCATIWLIYQLKSTKADLEMAHSAHAHTLESVIAAQMALTDGREGAVSLASKSLDQARAISALYFSENNIFHKDVMFIMEYNDEEFSGSSYLNGNQKNSIQNYLEKSRE
jgi:hypothetical protein